MTRTAAQAGTVALAAAGAWAPVAPATVEAWFSTGIYPPLQRALTPVSNLVPVAMLDLLILGATVGLLVLVARAVRGTPRQGRRRAAVILLRRTIVSAAALYLAFLLLWGLNYRRVSMTDRLVVAQGPPASDAVTDLGLRAAARLTELHAPAHEEGWTAQPVDDPALRRAFDDVQRLLSEGGPAVPARLKRSLLGPYFRWAGIDAMINPFGLEALANPDLLPFEQPFVAAHEWAHLAGYADESEASFVGFLTCLRASPAAQYSGWLALYWQVAAEVTPQERERIAAVLGPGPRGDLDAVVARVRRGEWPWLRDVGWDVYDQYLKANRVEEGVRSYGAVITLVLQTRFEEGWVPVRAAP